MTLRSMLVMVFLLGLVVSACGSGAAEEADSAATDQAAAAGEETTGGAGTATAVTAEELGVPQTDEMVDTAEFATEPPWTLGYADASLTNSWRVFAWQYMQWGASKLPETEILRTDANDNTSTQVSDIQDLVARDVDCLIVAATSESALSPVLESVPPDIPVVIMERAVDTDAYTSFSSLDAVEMGRLQAEAVVDALGGEGDIVILQGVAGSGPVEQSMEGMTSVLDENPGINVLTTEYTDWSRDNGKTAMENALQSFDQIDAVLSDSGLQNVGAFEAVEAAGRLDEIKAWTGDTVQAWIRIVHEEGLPGIIIDRPTAVGDTAVKTCGAILSGIPVPRVWVTQNQVLDPANLEQFIAPEEPGSEQWWDWWTLPEEWLPE